MGDIRLDNEIRNRTSLMNTKGEKKLKKMQRIRYKTKKPSKLYSSNEYNSKDKNDEKKREKRWRY